MNKNLDIAKDIACLLVDIDYQIDDKFGGLFVYHPFFTSTCLADKDGLFIITEEPERFKKYKEFIKKRINATDNINSIVSMISKPYRINYLVLINQSGVSNDVCGNILGEHWCLLENNDLQDKATKRKMKSWLKASDKTIYMSEEDLNTYNNLPDEIEIYRGGQMNEPVNGFSWSLSLTVAEWFANRFDNPNPIVHKALIKKKDVLAYTNAANEQEIIADYTKLYNIEEV